MDPVVVNMWRYYTLPDYFHFLLHYLFTQLQLRAKYCTFYSTINLGALVSGYFTESDRT